MKGGYRTKGPGVKKKFGKRHILKTVAEMAEKFNPNSPDVIRRSKYKRPGVPRKSTIS